MEDDGRKYAFHYLEQPRFVLLVSYVPLKPICLSRRLRKLRIKPEKDFASNEILENSSMTISCITDESYYLSGLFSRKTLIIETRSNQIIEYIEHNKEGVLNFAHYENYCFIFDFNSYIHFFNKDFNIKSVTLKQRFKSKYGYGTEGSSHSLEFNSSGKFVHQRRNMLYFLSDVRYLVKYEFDQIQYDCVNIKDAKPVRVHNENNIADFCLSKFEERIYILTNDLQILECQTQKSMLT